MFFFNIFFFDGIMVWIYYVRCNVGFFLGILKNGKSLLMMVDEG